MVGILHCYKSYPPDEIGGVAEAIATITSTTKDIFDHSILVARTRGLSRNYLESGIPVRAAWSVGTFWSLPFSPGYPFEVARAARSVDLIAHHAPFPLTDLGLLSSLPSQTAVVVHWHADINASSSVGRLINPLIRRSLAIADRIIVSHETSGQNSALLGEFSNKCAVIPYGVDNDYWSVLNADEHVQVAEIRKRQPRLIVSTGRLVPYKGHEGLLRALKTIDGTLIIVGKGPLVHKLQKQASDLGIADRVQFPGWLQRSQMKILLHAARIFAFPSVSSAESFGIAQLEAMAVGLPVVNTALPTTVPHVARHGQEALTVEPGDVDGLRSALGRLLGDKPLAAELGRAGQRRARSSFDWRLIGQQTAKVYMDALENRMSCPRG